MTLFRYEEDMRAPVHDWLNSRNCVARDEVGLPWGVCDCIGVEVDQAQVDVRRTARQFTRLTQEEIRYLCNIPPGGCYTQDLAAYLHLYHGWPSFKKQLKSLIKRRVIEAEEKEGAQYLVRNVPWLPMHKRLIAVEMKLSQASVVLHQAFNHVAFCGESWAAMPKDKIGRMRKETVTRFGEWGVGLLAVTPDSCSVIITARENEIDNVHDLIRALFTAECVWQALR